MRALKTSLAAGVLAAGLVASVAPAACQQPFEWRGRIANGRSIEIKNISGDLTAVAASGDEVRVSARKRGERSDPDSVELRVVEHGSGVTICAVYPAPRNREPNECRPGEGGRSNTRNNDVKVDFTVEVPRGVEFIGKNVNGPITATNLTSDASAHTVNGDVRVSTSGLAAASTVNGNVDVSMGRADWTGTWAFETVNGRVTIALPAEVNADVTAETTNGGITSDYPLTVSGRFGPKRINGKIGNGGRTLTLETVNGDIELRRR